MVIYKEELFDKYVGHPIRIKMMFMGWVAIAEGFPVAFFKNIHELYKYFPCGKYKLIS
ncbi:MAG: hypothetical protein ACOC3V_00860 [bacterium]